MKKFRGDRLFNLAKLIVNIITAFTLFFGILGTLRLEKINLHYLKEFDRCTNEGGSMQICGYLLDAMNDNERLTYLYLKIGLGLPIIFYGGLKLYNYLFPTVDEKE